MNAIGSQNADYERGITKLIRLVSRIHSTQWSPTPLRREIDEIAARLEAIVGRLDKFPESEIERVHDEPDPTETGVDGWPIPPPEDTGRLSYAGTKQAIRNLADSAREASSRLPDPREKLALPFAALGLLRLRHDHEFPPPTLSNSGADVDELDRVCRASGIFLSRERLRGALKKALDSFDPRYLPPGYEGLYR